MFIQVTPLIVVLMYLVICVLFYVQFLLKHISEAKMKTLGNETKASAWENLLRNGNLIDMLLDVLPLSLHVIVGPDIEILCIT